MHHPQARVDMESGQRRHLRTARAADAPRLLEHAAQPASARIAPAQHIVIAPRSEEPVELVLRRRIERLRLLDGDAHLRREIQALQLVEAAARDEKIRAAVHELTLVIVRRLLRAAVRGAQIADAYLADTERSEIC